MPVDPAARKVSAQLATTAEPMDFLYTLLYPLEWVVAWLRVSFHQLFISVGFEDTSGSPGRCRSWAWSSSSGSS